MTHQTTIGYKHFSLTEARHLLGLFAEAFFKALATDQISYLVIDRKKVITEGEITRFQSARKNNNGSMDSTV